MSGAGAVQAVEGGKVNGVYFGDEEPDKTEVPIVFMPHWLCNIFCNNFSRKLDMLSEKVTFRNEAYASVVPSSSIRVMLGDRAMNVIIKNNKKYDDYSSDKDVRNAIINKVLNNDNVEMYTKESSINYFAEMKNDAIDSRNYFESLQKDTKKIDGSFIELKNVKNNNAENELFFNPNVFVSSKKYENPSFFFLKMNKIIIIIIIMIKNLCRKQKKFNGYNII